MTKVGTKGQIVIDKAIRDALGVAPGWLALQRCEGDAVVVTFLPPPDGRSLKGRLAHRTGVVVPPGAAWEAARERAWIVAVDEVDERFPGESIPECSPGSNNAPERHQRSSGRRKALAEPPCECRVGVRQSPPDGGAHAG